MNQHTSDASNEGKYTFTLVFVVFIVMTGGFVFLATLYAEVIASWVSGTEAIGGAEYTKFDELWEPLSKWYSSVVGVFVGFAGAIVALWLAVQVHKLSEKQHKLTEKQHKLTERQHELTKRQLQTDQQLLKVEQFKFAKDRSRKNAKVGLSIHTAAKPSAAISKLFDLTKEARKVAEEKTIFSKRVKRQIKDENSAEVLSNRKKEAELQKKIRQLGEKGFPAVKELLDILEEKLLFSDIETSKRVLETNFGDFPSQIKPSLMGKVKYGKINRHNNIHALRAESALQSIEKHQENEKDIGLYTEAVISTLRFLVANLKAAEQFPQTSIVSDIPDNFWGYIFVYKIARPGDAFWQNAISRGDDTKWYLRLPFARFGTGSADSEEWHFVPSMINALFDFPTPFQVAEEELESIMDELREGPMNSTEEQRLEVLLQENLHHDIFQLNTKDDNGFFLLGLRQTQLMSGKKCKRMHRVFVPHGLVIIIQTFKNLCHKLSKVMLSTIQSWAYVR